ncbi:helicase-exonuclease AddAB subunit AddB [Sporosarcina pasteurii]|uniref:ATP-dependent helicase/deoxyribonuclease subunit B n=1 Tax=Sporosarcina pasteurii TaxID=1474 RepID=A0A380BE47_SPOPA|nr:helicase-exonuclease AddAB subunit AddB [Sporosarcina pasteurii]MDS9470352.1 helicase-exonuclease AddAB subunit AddB [Sporosarcina pasteurii]QBQ05939.1 helicase-exonuclease AddAB subunit AddB [Sporosarcina pasteurii]SUI99861.1 ATP-dependent helicase/deoxyribonuclease subunit B [Sporosarcina pasteurii]
MSLRLITGRSGSGKTQFIQSEIAEMLKQDPLGTPVFVIVPDQMSFSMEHSLSVNYGLAGIIRAQVVTFKRLAWRILQETGGITRKEVDGFGYRMLVRSVLEENQNEFKVFKQAASKRGFTEQIGDLMKEFSRYCLDFETMNELVNELQSAGSPQILLDKASDLSLLLTKIEEKLGTSYVDSEGHLALLASQIKHADIVKGAHIYIDGFENFTTREYEIITELMKYGGRVTVVLPMEADLLGHADHDLFFNSVRTYEQIRSLARAESVEEEETVHFTEAKRFKTKDLLHLEATFEQYPAIGMEAEGDVSIIEASDPRAEIHAVARTIRQLTMEGKRYKNIAILYREPEKYDVLLETIFPHYDIPVFISRKKPMLHHPLIEFSRSVLEAMTSGWSFESIFRAVKTDLFFPHGENVELWRERADRLENYVLAHGIMGSRWFDEKRWRVKRYRGLELHTDVQTDKELALEKEIHLIRDVIRTPLEKFEKRLRHAKHGQAVAEALFALVEELRVYDKIIDLRAEEERAGRLLGATEHEQAWNEWIQVLDQFVLMFGDKEMRLTEATKILDEGFDSLEFTRIPPSLDQVTVSTIELSNLMNTDAVFVLGVNEGVLPQRVDNEGILSDADREWFAGIGFELAPTSKMKLMDESYMAYRAFTSAREKLYVSYPIADEEGKALIPSLYIARIEQILTNCTVIQATLDPFDVSADGDNFQYISHPRATLPFAAIKLKEAARHIEITKEWQAVLAYYRQDMLWKPVLGRISRPMIKGNQTDRLQPEMTAGLYGESFVTSVSRIESYYSCPFQHYASFGLKLEERSEYTLEAPAIGDLFHAALKWVSDEIMRLGKSWDSLTKEECWQVARQAVEEITPYFFNRILLSTSRYMYIKRKLVQIIQRTIYSLSTQSKSTVFKPVAIEAGFGPGEQLPSLEIPLRSGQSMKLRGRIDRIDTTEIKGRNYLRVVDYKSSARDLELAEVYYGLSLQMLTYLDVALEYADELLGFDADPAGILYMHVHNPMIRPGEELSRELLEAEIAKSYKMRGYLLEHPEVVEGMDINIGNSSAIVPAAFRKDGSFTKRSKVLAPEDLQIMRTYVKSRHQKAGNAMLLGDTRVYPYKLKDRMPCQFCAYRSVCQFDPTDPNQTYRQYELLDAETSLEKMREEVAADEHTD